MNDDLGFKLLLGFTLGLLVFCVFGMVMGIKQGRAFEKSCNEKHGIVYAPRGHYICLKPDAVIE